MVRTIERQLKLFSFDETNEQMPPIILAWASLGEARRRRGMNMGMKVLFHDMSISEAKLRLGEPVKTLNF